MDDKSPPTESEKDRSCGEFEEWHTAAIEMNAHQRSPFSTASEIIDVLEECAFEDLTPRIMDFLESRRESWEVSSDRKRNLLLRRRMDVAKHYLQIAFAEITNRIATGSSASIAQLICHHYNEPAAPWRERIQRYVFLVTKTVIRAESRNMRNFLRDCVLYHEGPLQGYIKWYLRHKKMLGGDEDLENRVLRLSYLTFNTLLDRCTEPRLAYLRWARKCGYIADSGLAYKYIKNAAANLINQAARDALGPKPKRAPKLKSKSTKKLPKKKTPSYVVLEALGGFFEHSKALQDAMPTPYAPLKLSNEDHDAQQYCSRVSQSIFDEHFQAGKNGKPDRVWLVFWGRVIKGMPREELANYLRHEVIWIRKRESELRQTVTRIIDDIDKSGNE